MYSCKILPCRGFQKSIAKKRHKKATQKNDAVPVDLDVWLTWRGAIGLAAWIHVDSGELAASISLRVTAGPKLIRGPVLKQHLRWPLQLLDHPCNPVGPWQSR